MWYHQAKEKSVYIVLCVYCSKIIVIKIVLIVLTHKINSITLKIEMALSLPELLHT